MLPNVFPWVQCLCVILSVSWFISKPCVSWRILRGCVGAIRQYPHTSHSPWTHFRVTVLCKINSVISVSQVSAAFSWSHEVLSFMIFNKVIYNTQFILCTRLPWSGCNLLRSGPSRLARYGTVTPPSVNALRSVCLLKSRTDAHVLMGWQPGTLYVLQKRMIKGKWVLILMCRSQNRRMLEEANPLPTR